MITPENCFQIIGQTAYTENRGHPIKSLADKTMRKRMKNSERP